MPAAYGRDLDLNLLRVFVVVAETGSVTEAAKRLYVTQPAVSAALRRLAEAVGSPLFARAGRNLVPTARGKALFAHARPHLDALVRAALSPTEIDVRASTATVRLGLSDTNEAWLLPPLLDALAREAPGIRVVVLPVQFRTIGDALASGHVDLAVTVADDLPAGVERVPLLRTRGFVCLYDARHVHAGRRISRKAYFAHEHVIVSYNGDLRGIVEDLVGKNRKVRCSVSSFANIGAIVDGTAMLATIPELVAVKILAARSHLRTKALPPTMKIEGSHAELLWPAVTDDDGPCNFVRAKIREIARTVQGTKPTRVRAGRNVRGVE